MYLRKKGYVLLECMIFLCVISSFTPFYLAVAINNVSKSNYYFIENNNLYFNNIEIDLINLVYENLKSKGIYKDIVDANSIDGIDYKFTFNKDKNYWIEIKNNKIYLVNQAYSRKKFRLLTYKIIEVDNIKKIIFLPTSYKTDYI